MANTGWNHVSEVIAFHRRWMSAFPLEVQAKIATENARRFFGEMAEEAIRVRKAGQ
jgi:predicted TIM-barrel fold metal-dependent hydrolase